MVNWLVNEISELLDTAGKESKRVHNIYVVYEIYKTKLNDIFNKAEVFADVTEADKIRIIRLLEDRLNI